MKINEEYIKFPPRCCMRCSKSPDIDPDEWDKYIGTPIPCKLLNKEVMPTELCKYFTLKQGVKSK